MMLSHAQLRKLFSKFWEDRDHKYVKPISLLPEDSSTLFTGSGMQPLVPYLLGEPHPLGKKLYNIQPCFRAQDIEEVGDNRHTTFFEMMGNWSLGTYFKAEQLPWMWEFYHKILALPKEKLYITIFGGGDRIATDEESYQIWKKLGISEDHIHRYEVEHNWWSRAGEPKNMPTGEPGGPDSEIFFEFDSIQHDKKFGQKCHPNCECGRFLEIGNSVFMQYKKASDGTFSELPQKNVDFGGGLERVLAAVNDKPDVFTIDVFEPIVKAIEEFSAKKYAEKNNQSAMRVIADHLKASTFLIAHGVKPSNKDRGYVLRRLLRRSAVKMRSLEGGLNPTLALSSICGRVLSIYEDVLDKSAIQKVINSVIEEEMDRFSNSLDRGLLEINKIQKFDGKVAFDFYQNYGFPFEITQELAKQKNQVIDKKDFLNELERHKEISRKSAGEKFKREGS